MGKAKHDVLLLLVVALGSGGHRIHGVSAIGPNAGGNTRMKGEGISYRFALVLLAVRKRKTRQDKRREEKGRRPKLQTEYKKRSCNKSVAGAGGVD